METKTQTKKQYFKVGFIAGLGAGLIATACMLLLSLISGSISLPEVLGSELTALMPASMFDYLHRTIGGDAKHYLFDGILVGQCLVFALSGGIYSLVRVRSLARGTGVLPPTGGHKGPGNGRPQGPQPHIRSTPAPTRKPTPPNKPTIESTRVLPPTGGHKGPGRNELRPYSHSRPYESSPAFSLSSQKLYFYDGLLLAFILWLFVGFFFLPLTGAGIFGVELSAGLTNTILSLAIVGAIFGLLFVPMHNWLVMRLTTTRAFTTGSDDGLLARRDVLKRGFILAGVGILGIAAWRFITEGVSTTTAPVSRVVQHFKSKIVPPPVPNYGDIHPVRFLSPEVTPNDQYYVVSKNLFSDPTVDAKNWQLTVDGEVEHPFTLSYQQLLALPMQRQYESMMCVSNEVGGQYMSNARWEGVRLKDLLERAGVKAGAIKVVFYAIDDYSDSIHLDKALEPTTLLAVRMNGATLPQVHGFPVRMLVPGIYGMKHCKWLTRIEVVKNDYQGYWQQRGWSDPAPIRMTARIDTPLIGVDVPLNQTTYISGVAFSGNKGISEVDVSLDGGTTWQRATLKRPLSNLTWVLWQYPWQPVKRGTYTLVARAIDLEGNVQDPSIEPPAPNGSSGYESFDINVI